MPSLDQRKRNFLRRVNYAVQAFLQGEDSREFDNCFEMYDGEFVVVALVRKGDKDPDLRAAILDRMNPTVFQSWEINPWQTKAQKYRRVSDAMLPSLAAQAQIEAEWFSTQVFIPQLAVMNDPENKPFEIVRREGSDELKECFHARNLREVTNKIRSWTDRTVKGQPFLSLLAEIEVRSPDGEVFRL